MVRVLPGLILALALSVSAAAQTYLTTTTLTNAVSDTATTFTLGSVSGLAVGAGLYLDREYVSVRSVSGLNVVVARGQAGTTASAHTASRVVILIPAAAVPTVTTSHDPTPIHGVGGCTPSANRFLPIINVVTGNVWTCRWVSNVRVWAATNETLITYGSLIMQ